MKNTKQNETKRIITRTFARNLSKDETQKVSGGFNSGPYISEPEEDMCGGF